MNEAIEKFLNCPVVFGLEAQGHIQTVESMLADGKGWEEIGKAINWDGDTAEKFYQRYLAANGKGYWIREACQKHTGRFNLECPGCNMNNATFVETEESK